MGVVVGVVGTTVVVKVIEVVVRVGNILVAVVGNMDVVEVIAVVTV